MSNPNSAQPASKREYMTRLWLGAGTVALLVPFVGKAFHIDDPIFLWTAEQIVQAPADFFGFAVNWYGVSEPMHAINKNPPLVSYYLALVGRLGGWSEISLHLGMLLPAVLLVIGVATLAREFDSHDGAAAAIVVATPVFLVSATSLMSDVSMSALWCWALVFFSRGCERDRLRDFLAAGVLIGLAALAKYFALALIPLVILYGLLRTRRVGRWGLSVAIGGAIVLAFDLFVHARYGLHPIADVVGYATRGDVPFRLSTGQRAATGLFFLGGCSLGTLYFAPWLWTGRQLAIGGLVGGLAAAACVSSFQDQALALDLRVQQAIFALAGVQLVALALWDVHRTRSPIAVLLALWLAGVVVFAAFTNWTTNGRSILPAVPAIGILIARGLLYNGRLRMAVVAPGVAVGLSIALAVAVADDRLAGAGRDAARRSALQTPVGGALYFQGSWGFQRYMELMGVEKLELGKTVFAPGDRLVMPGNNTNLVRIPPGRAKRVSLEEFGTSSWVSILARRRAAGFHASVWGSLPFSFGPTIPERYAVYEFEAAWAPERRAGRRVKARISQED